MHAAQEKERDLTSGPTGELVTWLDFQIAYEEQYLSSLGESSLEKWCTVVNRIDEYIEPVFVQDLDSRRLSHFYGKLRSRTFGKKKKKLSEATIASYFRTLLAGFSWAAEQEMIIACPKLRVAKQSKRKANKMKGRPITLEEHERMKLAVKKVRSRDADEWCLLLDVLWLSGLRLVEALKLSWDWSDPFAISIDVQYPRYVIDGDAQKSGKSQMLPISPEFVKVLNRVTIDQREGTLLSWRQSLTWTKKVISSIGKSAKVVVNADGKFASAQDYRRSFGTRWAPKLTPADLQQLMRHATIQTTMEFYVNLPSDALGSRLWEAYDETVASGATGK